MYGLKYHDRDFFVWVDKGGTGKTNFSLGMKYKFDENGIPAVIVTNQDSTILKRVLKEDELYILKKNQNLSHINSVKIFDLEGHSKDSFILDVIKNCNRAIVPLVAELSEVQACVYSILEIRTHNPNCNIAILANKIKNEEQYNLIVQHISQLGDFKIFRFGESRSMPNMFVKGQSIVTMMQESSLMKRAFTKINIEYSKIFTYLNE